MNQVLPFKQTRSNGEPEALEEKVESLIGEMTLAEKIGQLHQVDATGTEIAENLAEGVRTGRVGAVINQIDPALSNELQRIAVEESRLGVPLLVARDVIHGFKTVSPIPLGQAASWNVDLVRACARQSACEAAACGVNWTFAPMIDVARDARWGRIAESFGEDPYLTGRLGAAMIEGLQGDDLADENAIAACAKHFAGYGASEAGRDYSATNIPENELRNAYLPPFLAAVNAGVATFMASFSDIDGVPATANAFLMRQILRDEWSFDGLVVSDWDSVRQLSVHGLTDCDRESAFEAAAAGVDMEMAGDAYSSHLAALVEEGRIDIGRVNAMAANVLRVKLRLGLFENPYTEQTACAESPGPRALEAAKDLAAESVVLLKNDNQTLPLAKEKLTSIAVIGPMADAPAEQLGTWVFDGDPTRSVTPVEAFRDFLGDAAAVVHAPAMISTRSKSADLFADAIAAAKGADVAVLFLGEEAILSGEAHSRADIGLPGNQAELVKALKAAGKPIVLVILAGRPLTLDNVIADADAVLFAWHPGSMAGPALCDLIFGVVSPSGKLPVSFPKMVGQIPIYYNHKNTGRPPSEETTIHIDEIEVGATQTSLGMTAFHLDAGYKPQFPFGFGLSYASFVYTGLEIASSMLEMTDTLRVSVSVANKGAVAAKETVQLYIRDMVGSITRPVKELKGFQKVHLQAGEKKPCDSIYRSIIWLFSGRDRSYGVEPGEFRLWVGGDSETGLMKSFSVVHSR